MTRPCEIYPFLKLDKTNVYNIVWYEQYVFNANTGRNEAQYRLSLERNIIQKIEIAQKNFISNPPTPPSSDMNSNLTE